MDRKADVRERALRDHRYTLRLLENFALHDGLRGTMLEIGVRGISGCGVETEVFVPVSLCVQELVASEKHGGVINSHVEKSLNVETF